MGMLTFINIRKQKERARKKKEDKKTDGKQHTKKDA